MSMKLFSNSTITSFFLFSLIVITACKEDEPSQQEKYTQLLTQNGGQWSPAAGSNAIILEDIDVTDELFPGFTVKFTSDLITVTGTSLTPSGISPVWFSPDDPDMPYTPDTWGFKDPNVNVADVIEVGSGREITIVSITATELVLQMEWDGDPTYGRTSSLPGVYTFTLTKP